MTDVASTATWGRLWTMWMTKNDPEQISFGRALTRYWENQTNDGHRFLTVLLMQDNAQTLRKEARKECLLLSDTTYAFFPFLFSILNSKVTIIHSEVDVKTFSMGLESITKMILWMVRENKEWDGRNEEWDEEEILFSLLMIFNNGKLRFLGWDVKIPIFFSLLLLFFF